jgi:hypothetical protein
LASTIRRFRLRVTQNHQPIAVPSPWNTRSGSRAMSHIDP